MLLVLFFFFVQLLCFWSGLLLGLDITSQLIRSGLSDCLSSLSKVLEFRSILPNAFSPQLLGSCKQASHDKQLPPTTTTHTAGMQSVYFTDPADWAWLSGFEINFLMGHVVYLWERQPLNQKWVGIHSNKLPVL